MPLKQPNKSKLTLNCRTFTYILADKIQRITHDISSCSQIFIFSKKSYKKKILERPTSANWKQFPFFFQSESICSG